MSQPIGVDLAWVDGNTDPDYVAAKKAGARFAILRAIYGRGVTSGSSKPTRDPIWARDKEAILDAGLKRSAYLFLCYEKPGVQTPSPEDQAQAFIDYVKLDPFEDFVPFFDVEEASPTMGAQKMFEWTVRCAQKLRDHYGAWPGMYTSARVWTENLNHHSPGPLLNCPLWLAKPWPWPVRTPAHLDGAPGYSPTLIPEFGNGWVCYQYQGDSIRFPGFDKTVDVNRFRVYGKGSRGQQTVWTQQRLGVTADGIFGPVTEAAVKELQKEHDLVADGIVGPDTFSLLCWSNPA